jgi:hypothetical protein
VLPPQRGTLLLTSTFFVDEQNCQDQLIALARTVMDSLAQRARR